jgi:hypothetical protein
MRQQNLVPPKNERRVIPITAFKMFEMMFPEEEQREKVARCEPLTLV